MQKKKKSAYWQKTMIDETDECLWGESAQSWYHNEKGPISGCHHFNLKN